MKKCPYCAEEIQDEAIKCKHCGEMIHKQTKVSSLDPSATAKAVNKGIKQKELDDFWMRFWGGIAFIIALIIGIAAKSFWWGFIIFVVCAVISSRWYYKE